MKEDNTLNMGNDRVLIIDDDLEIQSAYRLVLSPEAEDRNVSRHKLVQLLPRDRTAEPPASPQFDLGIAGQGLEGVVLAERLGGRFTFPDPVHRHYRFSDHLPATNLVVQKGTLTVKAS